MGRRSSRRWPSRLTAEFGKGFSETNLKLMRLFYLQNPHRIGQTVSDEFSPTSIGQTLTGQFGLTQTPTGESAPPPRPFTLSWSHYVFLLRIKNPDERSFYEIEAAQQNWTVRELRRQFDSGLYERLALSRDKEGIRRLAREGQTVEHARDLLKEPLVLEFLGLEERSRYSESDLESAIIGQIEHFLLELGKGFLFEARQKRFTFDEEHFFVDLVFYNRLLRCYVLLDLKLGKLAHQDLGQMQMYVNYFDRFVKTADENPTIGIVLCKHKNQALVEITLPKDANIHAREYQLYLPSKDELQQKLMEWIGERGGAMSKGAGVEDDSGAVVRAGWRTEPFERCVENVSYTRKIQRKDFLEAGEYPIVSQEEDFINGYWSDGADLFKVSTPVVVFGDHTKALKYVDFDFVLGADGIKILQPRAFLEPKFFYYQLRASNLKSLGYARHYRLLKEMEVAFPSRPEQQRIVAILDEAFDAIATAKANAEKSLQNAHALFESHLQAVFSQHREGWVERRLEDLVDAKCSLSYGIVQPGEEYPDGLPVIRPTDLTTKVTRVNGLKRIDPTLAAAYGRTALTGGELLLCVRGSTGIVSVASEELAGANVTRGIVPIRFDESHVIQEFGYYILVSGAFQKQIREKTYGAALMQINIRDLRNITLPFPPLLEQKTLVAKLDVLSAQTQRLESIYQQKLAALDALKKSLLDQAFNGLL